METQQIVQPIQSFPKPTRIRETQYERALRYRKNAQERAKKRAIRPRRPIKKKRTHLPSIRSLIAKADRLFSLYIRRRDGRCVLCGATEGLTNGHLIKRGKKAVRWDEFNCNCLCSRCNYRDNFDHDIYVSWFIQRYGSTKYVTMFRESRQDFKPKRDYLLIIIEKYTNV